MESSPDIICFIAAKEIWVYIEQISMNQCFPLISYNVADCHSLIFGSYKDCNYKNTKIWQLHSYKINQNYFKPSPKT